MVKRGVLERFEGFFSPAQEFARETGTRFACGKFRQAGNERVGQRDTSLREKITSMASS